jgi:hypothetical protein
MKGKKLGGINALAQVKHKPVYIAPEENEESDNDEVGG